MPRAIRLIDIIFQGQADTHYRGKRHARITEIRRRKSQKASIEQEQAAGKNQAAGEDSEGINTTTESGNSSEEQNEMDKLQKSENEIKNQETRLDNDNQVFALGLHFNLLHCYMPENTP